MDIGLSWVSVKDLKQAVEFYTKVVGLRVIQLHEEFGWAELAGDEEGMRFGLAQARPEETIRPGANAVVTFKVADIHASRAELAKRGVKLLGEVEECGHVKLQMAVDRDGNHFQLVELIIA